MTLILGDTSCSTDVCLRGWSSWSPRNCHSAQRACPPRPPSGSAPRHSEVFPPPHSRLLPAFWRRLGRSCGHEPPGRSALLTTKPLRSEPLPVRLSPRATASGGTAICVSSPSLPLRKAGTEGQNRQAAKMFLGFTRATGYSRDHQLSDRLIRSRAAIGTVTNPPWASRAVPADGG